MRRETILSRTLAICCFVSLASCGDGTVRRGADAITGADCTIAYTVTDLGTLGGSRSAALCINNHGKIVGYSLVSGDSSEHAFLYSNERMVDLGTLGGAESWATSINDGGQVVGWAKTSSGATHAFLFRESRMIELGTLNGKRIVAKAVNASGEIVGSLLLGDQERAFLCNNEKMTDLGEFVGDRSCAHGINDGGTIVGEFASADHGDLHAFVYCDGNSIDLGCLGLYYDPRLGSSGGLSSARAINRNGQIVGQSTTREGDIHAFLYDRGQMTDMGTLGGKHSSANAINSDGLAVGVSTTMAGHPHGFLYSNGTMRDLNTLIDPSSGWDVIGASGINESGQIVGRGERPNGQTHAILLSPSVSNK